MKVYNKRTRKNITQDEIQELRELVEYAGDDRMIELFKKFHETYNKLALFYRDKRLEEKHTLYFEEQLYKSKQKGKELEKEIKKLKAILDEESLKNVKLIKEI